MKPSHTSTSRWSNSPTHIFILAVYCLALTGCGTIQQSTPTSSISDEQLEVNRRPEQSMQDAFRAEPGRNIHFNHLNVEDGLSVTGVLGVVQDHKGFLWVGTEDGLNKYDGYSFEVFRHDPENPNSLSDSSITELIVDRDGILWIGTYRGGLNRFDPRTETFTRFEHLSNDANSISNNQVTAIHQDSSGHIWVGTVDGLNRYNQGDGAWEHYRSSAENPATLSADEIGAIYEDSLGSIWVGTSLGLDRLISDSNQFVHYQHDPSDATSLSGNYVQAIYQDRSGGLWIGTLDGGLNRYLYDRNWFLHYSSDPTNPSSLASDNVQVVFQDAWEILWVGTDSGLQWMDPISGEFTVYKHDPDDPLGLSHDDVRCIAEDDAGGLWFGTAYGGVSHYDRRTEQFSLLQGDPSDSRSLGTNSVWAISEDPYGGLWLGTNGMGLNHYDRVSDIWTLYRHSARDPNSLSNDVVMSVHQDDDGSVWIGTWGGGLNHLDVETGRFTHYRSDPEDLETISSDVVFLVYEDRDGDLWLGTIDGLNLFDRESGTFTRFLHDPLVSASISDNVIGGALYQDRRGDLWVGTHGGLNRLDKESETFTRFLHNPNYLPSLGHDVVFTIHEDSEGTLWVGTFGGGLDKFDRDRGTFTHYRLADGLPNEVVYGILEDDDGYLWLSTNDGLSRFDTESEVFRNFDISDGIQAKEFNYNAYYKNAQGEMFFGGINGVNIFEPDKIVDNPYVPPIVLESITQGGDPISTEYAYEYISETEIEWPNNFFEFEFAALDYFQPEQNTYAYKLEGFDDDWIYAGGKRYARYTNLPGGTYTLRVFAANNDGVWNTEGVSLTLTVVPPFWQTWWFISLFVFIAVLVAVSVYRLRVGNLEARSRELAEQVEERTRDLEERTIELERQRGELKALYLADEQLHQYLEINEVLQALVDTAVEILQCDKGAMLIWDDHGERLRVAAAHGITEDTVASVTFLPGEGIAGRVVETGQLIAIEDVNTDQRVTREIVDPEGIQAFMQVPIMIGDEIFGVFSADYLKPHVFSDQEKRLLTSLAQRAALAIENAKLYEDTKERLAQVAALSETAQAIASTLDLDRLLNIIIQQAATLLKADGGMINLVNWERMTDEVVATTGAVAGMTGMEASLESGLSGWVARLNQPVISNHVPTDERVSPDSMPFIEKFQLRSAAVAPLTIKDKVIGTLVVIGTEKGKRKFVESELDVLVSFANQAAIAIENARLYEQAKQLAVVEERQRLARELHDSVTQALYGMTLYAEAMSRQLSSGEMQLANEQLRELQTTAQEALREMRLLIFQLRPPNLEADGLVTVLRTRLEAVETRAGLNMEFQVDNEIRLPLEIEEGFYRIAQEALNNALKHASAQSVSVCLTLDEPIIVLEIIDDGIGFDPEVGLDDAGLGMDGMYERAAEIGGQLIVESKPGSGSKIRVEVPR